MAGPPRRSRRPRRGRRRRPRHAKGGGRSFQGLLPALLLLAFIGGAIAILYLFPVPAKVASRAKPPYEEFHVTKESPPDAGIPETAITLPTKSETEPGKGSLPRVAIIIDDMGYDLKVDNQLIALPVPLSFAFLPYAPFTKQLVKEAHAAHRTVMVHLPMEPESGAADPGPGVLMTSMSSSTLLHLLDRAIDRIPGAVGVNNHMGSRFTRNRRAMEVVLSGLKRRGLFFVDSRTTKYSVAYATARAMEVPALERAVFLDHDHDEREIAHQLHRLITVAQARGAAVAIGHPFPETYRVLARELPVLRSKVELVPVERLVRSQD